MRVLHVASGRLFGGIERMLVTLARCDALAGGALDSSFAICARGRAVDELRASGGRVECLGDVRLRRPSSVWRARLDMRRTMTAFGSEVVVCHGPWAYALFAPVARQATARVVWWQHDAATGCSFIERWAQRTPADLVISNSRWTARSAAAVHPEAAVEVIYCPVEPPPPFGEASRTALRASLQTSSGATVVLSGARLEPWKGQERLLRALAPLCDLPNWTLWIAGGPQRPHEAEYLETLRREAFTLGLASRVRWLGERTDMAAVIHAADVLCQPNVTPEPFGILFAEALFGGVPVVTTDMGGAPEIVGAQCGRMIPPQDDIALTAALHELIVDPALRRRLGAAGPRHAAARCDPSLVIPRLAAALGRLATTAAA